jgi:hypothetical protein
MESLNGLPNGAQAWSNRQLMDHASRREHEHDGQAEAAVALLQQRGLSETELRQLALACVRHRIRRTHVLAVAEPDPHLRLPRNPLLRRDEILQLFEEEEERMLGPVTDELHEPFEG